MLRTFRGKKNKTKESRLSLIFYQADADNRERARASDKNKQRRQISLETKHKNFIAVVRKREMLVASKLNMRGIEKESEKEPKQPIFL